MPFKRTKSFRILLERNFRTLQYFPKVGLESLGLKGRKEKTDKVAKNSCKAEH